MLKCCNTVYKAGSNAFSFLHATQSSEFLVSVVVLAEVFGLTLPWVRKLQAKYMDVLEEMKLMEAILASLRGQCYKSTDTFNKIFKESEKLAMEMGTQMNKPRTTNLQKNRPNFNSQTVEEYYHTAVYLHFMGFIINELSFKFPKSGLQRVGQIQKLLSPDFSDGFKDEVLFGRRITGLEADMKIRPFTKVSSLLWKVTSALPNIRVLFQLLCVLPVTTKTVERSFRHCTPENLSKEHNTQRSVKWAGFIAYPPGHCVRNEA
ncbi:hypothetical protein PR048_029004 [Dryococelus australis]|uniref:HAT C-terminal dimerisation domain-containing protein n=1 Tax=Dryococelus australis TaxID=614101 RepID=A0ABQ9GC66_9NEOP|nr:hypothetical protein PR048_029004 [Dryococelus australis]